MLELTTTRANPMIDPALHVWGWEIPIYLFLGGLVAGMMIVCGVFLFQGRHKNGESTVFWLPAAGLVLLSAGMLALFLDLEHKLYFWRLYTTFEITSPMSWGAWILMLVYPALAAGLLLRVPGALAARWPDLGRLSAWLRRHDLLVRLVAGFNLGLGVLLGIYTGVLLSTLGARPFWNSALLGPLFLISGLSSAAALVHMLAREKEERELLARADNRFLGLELVILALFLIGLATSTRVHAAAANLVLGGPLTTVFWVFVVGAGIVVPLIVQTLAVRHHIPHTPAAPLLVLAGGLALRFVFVWAGQLSHWNVM